MAQVNDITLDDGSQFVPAAGGDQSTEPKLEHLRGAGTDDVSFTVNIPAGTGDWFGGWDGLTRGSVDRFITEDLKGDYPNSVVTVDYDIAGTCGI